MSVGPGAATGAPAIVSPGSVVAEPWANGLGITRVLARRLAWRLSLAEIRGRSVFSTFPDTDRLLVLAGDQQLTLAIDGAVHRLDPGDMVRFPGEARVIPTPTSAGALVVNLMTPRVLARGESRIAHVDGSLQIPADDVEPAVVLTTGLSLEGERLPVGTALLPGAAATRRLEGRGVVARFSIHPVPAPPTA